MGTHRPARVGVDSHARPSTSASSTNHSGSASQIAAAGREGKAVRFEQRRHLGSPAEARHAEPARRSRDVRSSAAVGSSSRAAARSVAASRNTSATGTARTAAAPTRCASGGGHERGGPPGHRGARAHAGSHRAGHHPHGARRRRASSRQRSSAKRQDIEKRIARLVAAIETGGDAASLVAKLRELETRQTRHRRRSCSASGRCRAWHRPSSRTGWRSGGGCCAPRRRRRAPCCSASSVAASPSRRDANPISGERTATTSRRRRGSTSCSPGLPSSGRKGLDGVTVGLRGHRPGGHVRRRLRAAVGAAILKRERGGAPGGT